jgi:hypothetical protein
MCHAALQVFDGTPKARRFFLEESDCGIASVAKETADGAVPVIVIDAEVL